MPNELTNPDKVVTEERLAEFYQQILPYMGGMPDVMMSKFSKSDIYSTGERMVGVWTDGKPIYKKTFNPTVSSTATDVTHNIENICTVVKIEGMTKYNNLDSQIPIPYASTTGADAQVSVGGVTSTKFTVYHGSKYTSMQNCYITLYYTKTTDSAVEIGSDTDYSTTEKIVGTWIDGKPIWQRVISGTMPASISTNDWTTFATLENIDTILPVNGIIKDNNDNYFIPSYVTSGTNLFTTKAEKSGTSILLKILVSSGPSAWIPSAQFFVVAKYTKTSS